MICCLGAKFFLKLRVERRNLCQTCHGVTCVILALGIYGDFKYFVIFLIHRFGFGYKLGDVEGCIIGGGVGAG